MIERYLSDKIKLLSLLSIISVLYIHSGFHNYSNEILDMKFNNMMQEFISGKIGRCAVPLFYMISGFLFFQNTYDGIRTIYKKMSKRVYTLVIPYIIACLFFPLFFVVLDIIPGTERFINGGNNFSFFKRPISVIISSLFYKTPGGTSPLAFQLWFLRDLIMIVAISPILYVLRKYFNKYILVLLFFCLNLSVNISSYFPTTALFWFMLGDAIINDMSKLKSKFILVTFIIISFLEMYFEVKLPKYISIPITLLGIIGFWGIYDNIVSEKFILKDNKYLCLACSATFFIYLFHEPTLNIVRKLLVVIFGQSSFGFAVSYLLSPWIFAFIAIIIASLMRNYMPRVYSILVGGR